MIERLIVLGGAGDLGTRLLLPALAHLDADGCLPPGFRVVVAGRTAMDPGAYRATVVEALEEHAPKVAKAARASLAERCTYEKVDASDPDAVAKLVSSDAPVLVYLALPPDIVQTVAAALAKGALHASSRVAVEKPLGYDLETAGEVEAVLRRAFEPGAVVRVDHFLGLPAVRALLTRRLDDHHLDAVLDRHHVERVEIVWDETLALEGRAAYYDAAGALRDVVQSHLLQVMAIVAMDRLAGADDTDVRRAKLALLSNVRVPDAKDAALAVVRARYEAGQISGRHVPSYADEEGVAADRETETFVELVLHVDTPRWRGGPFVLRTGKALARRRTEIRVMFRRDADHVQLAGVQDDVLAIDIDDAEPGGDTRPAYAEVIRDALAGDAEISVGGTEVLASWAILAPYIAEFRSGSVPLRTYAAGSSGPDITLPPAQPAARS